MVDTTVHRQLVTSLGEMEARAALRQVLRVVRQSLSKGGEGDKSAMWTQYVLERFRADASETAPDPERLATRVKLLRDYTQLVGHVQAHRVRSSARAAARHAPRWPWITCAHSAAALSPGARGVRMTSDHTKLDTATAVLPAPYGLQAHAMGETL
jgi:hypothetical protein